MLISALKAALREDPPLTLEQVAGRAGYASDNSMKTWEPRLTLPNGKDMV
jgi:hypothetical protein